MGLSEKGGVIPTGERIIVSTDIADQFSPGLMALLPLNIRCSKNVRLLIHHRLWFISRSDLIPQHVRHNRCAMVFNDHHLHTVFQCGCFVKTFGISALAEPENNTA